MTLDNGWFQQELYCARGHTSSVFNGTSIHDVLSYCYPTANSKTVTFRGMLSIVKMLFFIIPKTVTSKWTFLVKKLKFLLLYSLVPISYM